MRKSFVKSLLQVAMLAMSAAWLTSPSLAAGDARKVVPSSAPRLALVIGNANYLKLGKLSNPGRDARLMAEKLQQLGFDVTEVADRDLKGMTSDVEDFAAKIKARGRDTVSVLYYAGHGLESDSINYLVPVSADIRKRADVAAQSLSVKRVADRLSGTGNQLNVLIIDACRDNPFPPSVATAATLGLVPMGAVYGVFIASSTGAGKIALDGEGGHSPYTVALAEALTTPGEKLEDVFKSVRRQVRLATGEQQIPWESTSVELDFYFLPPPPVPTPAQQLLAAARETGKVALYDLLIERFPDSSEAEEARTVASKIRQTAGEASAASAPLAGEVLARARQTKTPEAFDLVASLFPDTPEADEARAAASRLREVTVLNKLLRLDCMTGERSGAFETATIQGLRRASQLTDERYLWYRPTMAALRALNKIDAKEGCGKQKLIAAPRCLRINGEDYCQ